MHKKETAVRRCFLAALAAVAGTACLAQDKYLFAYFKGERDGLHLACSDDGLKWKALNGDNSMLRPKVGKDKLMRDPSICQGPDGTFHLVWTSSWHDKIIGYASSKDLANWSEQRAIPVMAHEPETKNCWAPEITYDDESGEFYIYWATTIPGRHSFVAESAKEKGWNHRIYLTTTKDFKEFTKAKLWFDPGFSAIDAAITKTPDGKRWMMVVKNENPNPPEKNVRTTFTEHLADGFPVKVSKKINFGRNWVEGPAPLVVGSDIFVYYDVYAKGRYGVSVSHDGGATWEDRSGELELPRGIRHGTAFRVDSGVVEKLLRMTAPQPPRVETEIPGAQGTRVNPKGEEIIVTTKCIRFNGEPKVPVMGEMHYARVPEGEWRDYIRKMKDGGVDILATYAFWVHHEEKEGEFDFSGRRDIGSFLKVCEEECMPVVLRIGPWCHGECVEGGLPDWVISRIRVTSKKLRSANGEFLGCVEKFWKRLGEEAKGHLWKDGGCVIGVQLENECSGPWPYMEALKKLAIDCGFDVPFYTRTGWPKMRGTVKYGEILPLFGDYADGFWERRPKVSPGDFAKAFKFSNTRVSANIATEQLPQSHSDDQATAQYPYLTCELGGGMPSSYAHRVRVTPMDTYAMALVKLGCGSNMLGYYMYAGGTNPNRPQEGVFFNERQSSKYTNHNDLPPFSYEFYGPISEFGETTYTHAILTPLHKFCKNFAADFALADVEVIDEHNSRRGPFLFHSDYMRYYATNSVPYIVPKNWKTRLGTIKSATLQPVEWDGDTLVMMKIPGLEPKVEFDGEAFAVRIVDFPQPEAPKVREEVKFTLVKEAGTPREVKMGPRNNAQQPAEEDWENAAEWEVALPESLAEKDYILEADYLGDVARVYIDDVPVADDFYKGLPLRCALWRIGAGKLTIRVLPWSDSPLIYVQPPFRPTTTGAAISRVSIIRK